MSTNPNTITGQINLYIFDLLTEHPEGIQWSDLIRRVEQKFPDFHHSGMFQLANCRV